MKTKRSGHRVENGTMRSAVLLGEVRRRGCAGAVAALAVAWLALAPMAQAADRTFASADDAVAALVQAAKANDHAAILAVLGNASTWVFSGDAPADRAALERFVSDYDAKHTLATSGDRVTLTLGKEDDPFAFPIVKSGDRWRFDTEAGKEELLKRRVGRNELDTIRVLGAIVDAEREYAERNPAGGSAPQYAMKFASSPGKRDGLYWPVKEGEPPSPLGALVAAAAGQGYQKSKEPAPFHGYYYRMLSGQTANAKSGAVDYVVRGRAIGGFAAIAYPAKYGNTGVMTFIVNHDGTVYQSDLGPETAAKAAKVKRFDPGKGWAPVASR
jgi:Protein of unknown function (DUF2950)